MESTFAEQFRKTRHLISCRQAAFRGAPALKPAAPQFSGKERFSVSQPPSGITGAKLTEPREYVRNNDLVVSLDWLQGSLPMDEWCAAWSWVENVFGQLRFAGGFRGYSDSYVTQNGVILAVSPTQPRQRVFLSLSGEACRHFQRHFGSAQGAIREMATMSAKFTRIDIAVDDHTGSMSVPQFRESTEAGYLCGFRVSKDHTEKTTVKGRVTVTGDGIGYGRPGKAGALKYAVAYDKRAEQRQKTGVDCGFDWCRFEARFFKAAAHAVAVDLGSRSEGFTEKMGRIAVGVIDFRHSPHLAHLTRRRRCTWWQKIVDRLGSAKTIVPNDPCAISKKAAWVQQGVLPTLVQLRDVVQTFGVDFSVVLANLLDREAHRAKCNGNDLLDCDPASLFEGVVGRYIDGNGPSEPRRATANQFFGSDDGACSDLVEIPF